MAPSLRLAWVIFGLGACTRHEVTRLDPAHSSPDDAANREDLDVEAGVLHSVDPLFDLDENDPPARFALASAPPPGVHAIGLPSGRLEIRVAADARGPLELSLDAFASSGDARKGRLLRLHVVPARSGMAATGPDSFNVAGSCGLVEATSPSFQVPPQSSSLSTFANRLVLAGYAGRRLSLDLLQTTLTPAGPAQDLTHASTFCSAQHGGDALHRAIAFGRGLYVAGGGGASAIVQISRDGERWSRKYRVPGASGFVSSIAYGRGRFVAVGGCGLRMASQNGFEWELAAPTGGPCLHFREVAFGNGRFVAVGPGRAPMTSVDGVVWTALAGAPDGLEGLSYGSSNSGAAGFVGVAGSVPYRLADGATVFEAGVERIGNPSWGSAIFAKGRYHIWVNDGTADRLATSVDGRAWVLSEALVGGKPTSLSFADGRFFGTRGGWATTRAEIYESADGIRWVPVLSFSPNTVTPLTSSTVAR